LGLLPLDEMTKLAVAAAAPAKKRKPTTEKQKNLKRSEIVYC
jgi:hypothetical protein